MFPPLTANFSSAFTAGLVESIWPLSACPPRVDPRFYGGGVLPLKTFIQETLRRSKTSYSTLQVALYYLIVLKDHLPTGDLTKEQPKGDDCRAMQCGRRMFLAALILASKYLQDRNYSTRAWSKISGLRTVEINQNEIKYLTAIDWKLHLQKETFDRWSRIVLRLSAVPKKDSGLMGSNLAQSIGWKILINRITPELPEDFSEYENGIPTPPVSPPSVAYEPSGRDDDQCSSVYQAKTTQQFATPMSSEPTPRAATASDPTLPPPLRPLHTLPTPRASPFTNSMATPAVSDLKIYPQYPPNYAALSNVRREGVPRATVDCCPPPQPSLGTQSFTCHSGRTQGPKRYSPSRSGISLTSSPESVLSDDLTPSTRSRSSSISSVSTDRFLRLKPSLEVMHSARHCCRAQKLRRSSPSRSIASLVSSPESMMSDSSSSTTRSRSSSNSSSSSSAREIFRMIQLGLTPGEPSIAAGDEVRGEAAINQVLRTPGTTNLSSRLCKASIGSQKSCLSMNETISESDALGDLYRISSQISGCIPNYPSIGAHYRAFTSMDHIASNGKSLEEMDALDSLCNLGLDLSRPTTALPPKSVPQAPQGKKADARPSKPHKRSRSNVSEALQHQVRLNLQTEDTDTLSVHDSQAVSMDQILPTLKAPQSPSRSWAPIKTPLSIRNKDSNKRQCASENYENTPERAAAILRWNMVQNVS